MSGSGRVSGSQPAQSIRQADQEADKILEFIGLKAKRSLVSGRLPLLDRKRLELGEALATRPKVLLLDEILEVSPQQRSIRPWISSKPSGNPA